MKIRIVFFSFLLFPLVCLGQNKITIYGHIEDSLTGEKLPGANIINKEGVYGTTSNNSGFFNFTTKLSPVQLIISHEGYSSKSVSFNRDTIITIKIVPLDRQLEEVKVVGFKTGAIENSHMSHISLSQQIVKSMPRLLGETDVLKTLQLLPGISAGSEVSSSLIARGGGPEQNLILLDGTQVYNPFHFLGIFSTFNGDAIKSIDLYKGGFPARFGGRLSSVVDLVMKDGNMKEFHGEGSIGLLASNLLLEGPIKKDKTSFLVSGRRTYMDLIAAPLVKASSKNIKNFNTYFYDLNFKIHHIFSSKDRVFASFFSGQDVFKVKSRNQGENIFNESSTKVIWGNMVGTLQWHHIFNRRLFSKTLLNYTQYRFFSGLTYTDKGKDFYNRTMSNYVSKIKDVGLRTDFDYRPSNSHSIKAGYSVILHKFQPSALTLISGDAENPELNDVYNTKILNSPEMAIYAEDDWNISKKLKINFGIHGSAFKSQTNWYNSLQPRLAFRYLLPENLAFKGSYSKMTQYIHYLTNNSTSLPTDLWVPSTDKVKPMQAEQWAIGLAKPLKEGVFEVSIEAYYKKMNGVIEYLDGSGYLDGSTENWDNKVEAGRGISKGIELFIQKKYGNTTGWFGYTLSKSTRQFPTINSGREFYYKYDRRHDFEIMFNQKLTKNLEFTATWQFQTGNPFTLPVAQYEGETANSPHETPYEFPYRLMFHYEDRNAYRLLNYHRLDAGITSTKQKKGYVRSINFSLFNVYNRRNPFYYYMESEYKEKRSLKGVHILPIIPSISYSIKF